MKPNHEGLVRSSTIAFLWGSGGGLLRVVLQLVVQVALARVLGPEAYGLFALGLLLVGLGTYLADFGLAYGLIQKPVVTEQDVCFVWTWQWVLGLTVACICWAGSAALAGWFEKPAVESVFAWLALVCLVNALTAPATNLLKKALDYKTLQIAQLTAYLVGYLCIGLPMAVNGFGVHYLVAAMNSYSLVNFTILYAKARHPIGLRFVQTGGLAMLGYGVTVLGTNLVNWLMTGMDKLLIGKLLPAHTVGAYTTAFNLVNSPAAAAYGSLQSVVFSAGARLQGDIPALKAVFLQLLAGVFLTAFPLFAVLGVGADMTIAAVYGPRWAEAAPYLGVFAFAMPWLLVCGVSTPVLWNTGHTSLELVLQLPMAFIWGFVLWAVSSQPGPVIALTAAGLFGARAAVMATVAGRLLGVTMREAVRVIAGGIALTGLMSLGTALLVPSLGQAVGNAQLQLLCLLTTGGAIYLLGIVGLGPLLVDRAFAKTLRGSAERLPKVIAIPLRLAGRERKPE